MEKALCLLPVLLGMLACGAQPQATGDVASMVDATSTAIAQGSPQIALTLTPVHAQLTAAPPPTPASSSEEIEAPTPITANKFPTLQIIIESLEKNGFILSENGEYAKNIENNVVANMDIGCGLRIVIILENAESTNDQIAQVRNVLIDLYPREISAYYDKYVRELLPHAKESSEDYYGAPTLEILGYTVDFSTLAYSNKLQIAVQNSCGSSK